MFFWLFLTPLFPAGLWSFFLEKIEDAAGEDAAGDDSIDDADLLEA
jgi:hypothetical protein